MDTDELRRFVLDRLDEAESRGRLRVARSDDGTGLLLLPGPVQAPADLVPFPEKVALLRDEVERTDDAATLRLLAGAFDTHHDWQEEWR